MKKEFTTESIDNVASRYEIGQTIIFGCLVNVVRIQEPFKYVTNTGKQATKSARYWGEITYPDGTKETFKSARGGAVSRACGFWSRKERDDRNNLGKLHEITNRRIIED